MSHAAILSRRHPLQIPPPQFRGSCQCVGSLVSYNSRQPVGAIEREKRSKEGWRISAVRAPKYLSVLERAGNAVRRGPARNVSVPPSPRARPVGAAVDRAPTGDRIYGSLVSTQSYPGVVERLSTSSTQVYARSPRGDCHTRWRQERRLHAVMCANAPIGVRGGFRVCLTDSPHCDACELASAATRAVVRFR